MTKLVLFILAVIVSISKATSSLNYRPGGKKMLIYGLFQDCSDGDSSHLKSNITQEADVCRQSIEFMNSKKMEINDAIVNFHSSTTRLIDRSPFPKSLDWNMDDIEYKSVQICLSKDLSFEVVKLLLDKDNFVKWRNGRNNKNNIWNGRKIYIDNHVTGNFTYSRILAIFLYADEHTSRKVIQILTHSQFPIYHLKFGWTPPPGNSLYFRKRHVFTEAYIFDLVYNKLTKLLRWKKAYYFTMIFLKSDNFVFDEMYRNFRYKLEKQSEFCFKAFEIQSHERLSPIIKTIKTDKNLRLILTFGDPKRQVAFFNDVLSKGLRNLSWIFQDVNEKTVNFTYGIPKTISILTLLSNSNYLFRYMANREFFMESPQNCSSSQLKKQATCKEDLSDIQYYCRMKTISLFNAYIYGMWKEIESRHRLWYSFFHSRFQLHVKTVYSSKPFYILRMRNDGSITRSWATSFYKHILNTTCPIPICGKGSEKKTTIKNSYYGPNCVQCPSNYYKSKVGNINCQPCRKYTLSTTNRDSCFDPCEELFTWINQWSTRIALLVNVFGGIFSSFAIVTLIHQQNTPLVRALDLKISILHLISLLLTFIITPYLFIRKPVTIFCVLRPLCISILNNLSVAFVIAKSQRLLRIFKSTMIILSEGEMRRYNAYVGTGIFLICGIGQAFLLLPASKIKPEAKEIRMDKQMVRDIYCNTEDYINIQLGYLILLQLFTSFQAFKCRSLPGPFNEAMPIVYSTLIVIATYSVTFPIYYFQHIESMKANVHFISLSVANLFPMLILYGNRLYIVVFKRKKNSKNYVRKRIWTFSSE